jgi:Tol biopolymer transport system component
MRHVREALLVPVATAAAVVLSCAAPVAHAAQSPHRVSSQLITSTGGIVFQGPDGLTLIRSDGSGSTPYFTTGESTGQHPDWAPRTRQMVFTRDAADGTTDIWVADARGDHQRRVVDCSTPGCYAENPAWDPTGTRIAYWTNGPTDITQVIRIVDAATGRICRTISAPDYWAPVNPRWSPDGRSLAVDVEHYTPFPNGDIVFDGDAVATIDLWAARPNLKLLTPFSLLASYPAWSPDGTRIMFMAGNLDPFFSPQDGQSNLFTIRPNGRGLRQITHQKPGDPLLAGPDWSTGDHPILVSVISAENGFSLGRLNADGSDLEPIVDPATGQPVGGAHPRAIPEGD